ncbi:MAG: acyltransferase [Lachnospiraceae bacterium]|nr:acyltransferase [Lachnospiraceae bacterium]
MQKKSNAIVLWRIIATYMVAIAHFDDCYYIFNDLGVRNGVHVVVDFFFIMSGYLMFANFEKLSTKCKNGFDYFVMRYKKVYPAYLGGFILCFILYVWAYEERPIDVLVTHVFELFCMQGIGLNQGWVYVNNSMWYLSVMLIAGFIIFQCLLKWKDTFVQLIAPIIVMITFSYFFRNVGHMNAVAETDGLFINRALMRALSGMCLGIFAVQLNRFLVKEKMDTFLVRLLGTLGFLFVIVGSFKFGRSEMDFLFVIVLAVTTAIAFLPSENKILGSRVMRYFSDLTFSIYVVHYGICQYIFGLAVEIPTEFGEKILYLAVYLIVITIAAVIFDFLVSKVQQLVLAVGKYFMKYLRRSDC